MVADSFIKSQMHRMPTYDEVIYDAMNSKERINLPDRRATQLRMSHQLTRFDEVDETPDLAAEQDRITKERIKGLALQGMGVGPDETASLKRAEMEGEEREHKSTQTGTATSTEKHYRAATDPSYVGSTKEGRDVTSGEKRSKHLIDDDRNFLERGIDKMFGVEDTENSYLNQPRRIAELNQHQKELHDYKTRAEHLNSLRGRAASKTSQTSKEVRDHLEAQSSSDKMPFLIRLFKAPSVKFDEHKIGTPGASVASSRKPSSVPSSKHTQGEPIIPIIRDLLTHDNVMKRYMLATQNNLRL